MSKFTTHLPSLAVHFEYHVNGCPSREHCLSENNSQRELLFLVRTRMLRQLITSRGKDRNEARIIILIFSDVKSGDTEFIDKNCEKLWEA